jgi:hypothetical protein
MTVQLLPAPVASPPYDDELVADRPRFDCGDAQGRLALAFALPSGLPVVPTPTVEPLLRVVPDPDDDSFEPRATPTAELPPSRQVAPRLVQALVEVAAGARPVSQLVRWTNEQVYNELTRRVRRLAAAGAPGNRGVVAGAVRSLHVSEPSDGIAEICAVVQRQGRATALAVRLEGLDGRWQCTAAEFE